MRSQRLWQFRHILCPNERAFVFDVLLRYFFLLCVSRCCSYCCWVKCGGRLFRTDLFGRLRFVSAGDPVVSASFDPISNLHRRICGKRIRAELPKRFLRRDCTASCHTCLLKLFDWLRCLWLPIEFCNDQQLRRLV